MLVTANSEGLEDDFEAISTKQLKFSYNPI
jgi:hypothetical protein